MSLQQGGLLGGYGRMLGNWNESVGRQEGIVAQGKHYRQLQEGSRFNAEEAKKRTRYEAWRNDVYARRVEGKQRQAFAVAGVDLSGSAIDDLVATMEELTLDKVNAIATGQNEERALRAESKYFAEAAEDANRAALLEQSNRKRQQGLDFLGMGLGAVASMMGMD
jgi:hypothetical protein